MGQHTLWSRPARTLALMMLIALPGWPAYATTPPISLGVVYETVSRQDNSHNAFVRPAFVFRDGEWTAYDPNCLEPLCFVGPIRWTIGVDGRAVGSLSTRPPPGPWRSSSEVGSQLIREGDPPWIGERDNRFTGWQEGPLHRPLVATTGPFFSDPAGWEHSSLRATDLAAVRDAFRARYSDVRVCTSPLQTPKDFTSKHYSATDIIASDTYASRSGWRIISLSLPKEMIAHCDGVLVGPNQNESPWASNVYAIAPSGEAKWLGIGLRLIGAGDWNGDGTSELMFFSSLYNLDGLRLFSDNFTKSAMFQWSYH